MDEVAVEEDGVTRCIQVPGEGVPGKFQTRRSLGPSFIRTVQTFKGKPGSPKELLSRQTWE